MVSPKTVRLYGKLGALFGRVHKLAVNSSGEAIHALSIMIPGFGDFMRNAQSQGLEFAVFSGKSNLDMSQLADPVGKDDIRIAPVPIGRKSGGGIIGLIGGLVLIVVGAVTANPALMMAGAGLMLGGAMMMMSPQAKGLGTDDKADNRPSYNFNGAVNTAAQGRCVPLAYGTVMAGSAVISAGIFPEGT